MDQSTDKGPKRRLSVEQKKDKNKLDQKTDQTRVKGELCNFFGLIYLNITGYSIIHFCSIVRCFDSPLRILAEKGNRFLPATRRPLSRESREIGRASCRERV